MDKNFRIGGILAIISGVLSILLGILIFANLHYAYLRNIVLVVGIFVTILGVFSAVAGYFSLKYKVWGLALAAAIIGVFPVFPTGIAAIVFVSLGRKGFQPVAASG